jgi:hypothetical protein
MAHDVRPARDLRSFDATSHFLRRVTGDCARQTTVSRVQGEHLERAESRKVADCEISVLFDFSYGYGRKIQTCYSKVHDQWILLFTLRVQTETPVPSFRYLFRYLPDCGLRMRIGTLRPQNGIDRGPRIDSVASPHIK